MLEQWCPSALQGVEIDRFSVRRAMLPTSQEKVNPFARQGPDRRLG